MLLSYTSFSQKNKQTIDTTIKPYLVYRCTVHPEYVSNAQVKCPICNNLMNLSPKELMKAEVVKLYTCPMHPNVLCTKTGKCPDCKKDMVEFKPKNKKKNA